MPALLADYVWEGTADEMTDVLPDLRDGHIYKQLDTGESYVRRGGVWNYINLGLAFIKATKSGRVTTDASGEAHVIFATPFINNEYSVALTCTDDPAAVKPPIAYVYDRQITGFKTITRNPVTGLPIGDIAVSWLATRDYNP